MNETEKKVKIAYCGCGASVIQVTVYPDAESNKDFVKEFYRLAQSGDKIETVTLEEFYKLPFLTCDCDKKKKVKLLIEE